MEAMLQQSGLTAGVSGLVAGFPALLTLLGLLAALVSIITEVTKNVGWLRRIPTDAQVIVLSLLLSLLTLLAALSRYQLQLSWYMPVGALVGGLLVAFIAMYGWATCFDLLQRFDHSRVMQAQLQEQREQERQEQAQEDIYD